MTHGRGVGGKWIVLGRLAVKPSPLHPRATADTARRVSDRCVGSQHVLIGGAY